MLYLTHAQLPTSTRHALKCDFIAPGVDSLILGKQSTIEVYGIESEGLKLLHQAKVFDVVEHINSYKKLTDSTSTLLVLTADLNLFTLRFCPKSATIITTASISLHQIGARPADYVQTSIVDPHGRCVVLHALNGILHVIPLVPGCLSNLRNLDPVLSKRKKANVSTGLASHSRNLHPSHNDPDCEVYRSFQLRLNEVNVQALNFATLSPNYPPTLLVVYSNHLGDRVLRSRKIDLQAAHCEQEFFRGYHCCDPATALIIPFSLTGEAGEDSDGVNNGAILIGEETAQLVRFGLVQYSASDDRGNIREAEATAGQSNQLTEQGVIGGHVLRLPLGHYTCFCPVDGVPNCWLLGDLYGNLIFLFLKQSTTGTPPSLHYFHAGHVPSPEALVYITSGFVFLASHYGDSQLLKLPSPTSSLNPDNTASAQPEVITTFPNLAPISDFCVTEDRKSLVNQIVTCSGSHRDGSLRVIKHGIGIRESGSLEVGGVQRLWALRSSTHVNSVEDFDDRLVLSCADCTRFLALNEDGTIEEIGLFNGFESDVPTILAGNLLDGSDSTTRYSIQVTSRKIIAGDALVWEPDDAKSITRAALSVTTCAVSLKEQVVVLCIKDGKFVEKGTYKLLNDISSLAIDQSENFVAAAQWVTNCIEIISVSSSSTICRVNTDSDFMVNSLKMTNFEGTESDGCRLLIGLGDGKIMNVALGPTGMHVEGDSPRFTTLGIRPIEFVSMRNATGEFLWANSDQPTIIDRIQNNGRFAYTPVTVQGGSVSSATGLHARFFQDSLVLASNDEIRIGKLNTTEKMNILKISLGNEQPRRIAHSEDMKAYGVVCARLELDQDTGTIHRIGTFKVFDDETFQLLYTYNFGPMEQGSSIAAVKLGEEMIEHFVIGTGVIKSTEAEATIGRILAIRELNSKQDLTAKKRHFELTNVGKLSGAVGGVGGLPNGMFVASANAFVHAFGLKKGDSGRAFPSGTDTVLAGSVPEMDGGFRLLDTWGGGFVSQTVVTDGTKVLVGDLYKSVVLLEFDLEHLELAVKARDFSAMSVRPIGAISEREFVAADSEFNMFTVQYDSPTSPGSDGKSDRPNQDAHREDHGVHLDDGGGSDEDDDQDDEQVTPISSPGPFGGDDEILQQVGAFYLGENVNHFRRGSLVPRFIESSLIGETKLIFVTSTGGIGLIAKIHSKKKTKQLARFQSDLSKISTSVGNLAHSAYRMFKTESRKIPSMGFLDGDFLEGCLDLTPDEVENLVKKMMALKAEEAQAKATEGDSKPQEAVEDNSQDNPDMHPAPTTTSAPVVPKGQAPLVDRTVDVNQVLDSLAELSRLH
ncbi:hypothetical protein PGT21_006357 [Puccinia graminis f. sp. tritici]|uniref:DNA damage-binding protein 1 n=1 Tax=Puccinia graminis f. sp. tritici TaxID=56615 RepID=A0A5B0QI40_PUCGR|nr:hypothetical protein PGT21_006357 [Puccinia graminis f. sp. tritici]